jgi:hypothetical protein
MGRSAEDPPEDSVLTENDLISEFVDDDDIVGGPPHLMYARLAKDDYAGALMVAEGILEREPDNRDALQCRDMSHAELKKAYLSRIGSIDRVPQLAVEPDGLRRRITDAHAEHILGLVDGLKPVSHIVHDSELTPLETLRVISELYLRQIVEFEDD